MKKLLKIENLTILAIFIGIAFGYYLPNMAIDFKIIGDVYIALLKMLILPLIFASIFIAILSLGSIEEFKDLGIKAFAYYLATTSLAVGLGLIVVNIFNPGSGGDVVNISQTSHIEAKNLSIHDFILSFIPSNIFEALSKGAILPVIFFVVFFAIASLKLQKQKRELLYNFFDSVNDSMMVMAKWIIALTPIGVFSLIGYTIGKNGLTPLIELYSYALTVLFALFIHALITLPLIAYIIGKFNPFKYFSQIKEALLIAFSTASSSATLPVSMEVCEQKGGVDKKVAGFILPLGATVNMDGTALYESIAVLFIANISGVDLTLSQQIIIFLTATFASIGAAGIPGAGLVMMTLILDSVGLPIEYISLIIAVDRFLDMFRTSINVWGDLIGAKLLNRFIK